MKTLEQVLEGFESQTLDGRDANRLFDFLTEEQGEKVGITLKDEFKGTHTPKEWTRENVLERLEKDVAFGFEKALNQRGISSGLMFAVVQMWNNILEDGLENWPDDDYAMYGLPLFKATAVKYGWNNPIGDDLGSEDHYNG